jgi:hypothetical protein
VINAEQAEEIGTVRHWLIDIESHPQLYPFVQGQDKDQKAFRVRQVFIRLLRNQELLSNLDITTEATATTSWAAMRNGQPPTRLHTNMSAGILGVPMVSLVHAVQLLQRAGVWPEIQGRIDAGWRREASTAGASTTIMPAIHAALPTAKVAQMAPPTPALAGAQR